MNFKLWLETDVKFWQDKIQSINRDFAFSEWFPKEGRIYLPFQPNVNGIDDDLSNYFKDHEYQIHDYQKGLLANKKGKLTRIIPVINKDEKEEEKRIQLQYSQKQISDAKYNQEMDMNKRYFNGLRTAYESSPFRVGLKNPYVVIITNTPEDIAGMSTNRGWTSCMNLKDGANRSSVWCELKNGGFVAYLCYSNDTNIDKPLARIHIRRFDNKKGQSIAIPEETIYGNEVQGFRDVVQKWIDSKQGRIRPGQYIRKGGMYSDTFGSANSRDSRKKRERDLRYTVVPSTAKGLFKLLDFYLAKGYEEFHAKSVFKVLDKLVLNDEQKQKLVNLVKDKFPSYKNKLFQKYPELLTPEDFKKMDHYNRLKTLELKKDDPRYAEAQKEMAIQKFMSLDINDPNLEINKKDRNEIQGTSEITDKIRDLGDVGQLPEAVIRKVVEFAEQVMERYKSELNGLVKNPNSNVFKEFPTSVLSTVIHAFQQAHADTPIVIKFYHKLLPYWDALGGAFGNLGTAIGFLGINGQSFLPFLKEKLKERESERLLWIIDSIENGKGFSQKYAFN